MNTIISNSKLSAIICNKGAELISLKNFDEKEYIWNGNPKFWGKHAPVLFPIVGTLKNNYFYFNDKKYHLSRHGFARDMVFDLIDKSENYALFSLSSNDESKTMYPFDFELQIKYFLDNNILNITYIIINKSNIKMPFSIGAHPAFLLPEKFEDYFLFFEHNENLIAYELENDLLSNKTNIIQLKKNKLPLTYSLFEKDALIFKELKSKIVTIFEKNKPLLKVKFNDFKNLGIWTKNNAPFICIEPWLGYSDTIGSNGNIIDKEAIQFVESKKEFECCFTIEIL